MFGDEDPFAMIAASPEDYSSPVIAAKERTRLKANAEVIRQLEDIYSLMFVRSRPVAHSLISRYRSGLRTAPPK